MRLRVGFIVNPAAGAGGAVALKGSDGMDLQAEALSRGGHGRGVERGLAFLRTLIGLCPDVAEQTRWYCWAGPMGGSLLAEMGLPGEILGDSGEGTSAQDTRTAARMMRDAGADLLIFVGGDGTARDLLEICADQLPVLGIPAGVKMHSGVFAVTPRTGAALLERLVNGGLVAPIEREVRDFDSEGNPDDGIPVRTYGWLLVPEAAGYLQQTKIGGKESEPLAVEDICADILERVDRSRAIVLGPGSTCARIKSGLGMPPTLRGCDVLCADGTMISDATAAQIEAVGDAQLVVSFSRGQGFLFGRGNQQLSAAFLSHLHWPHDFIVVGSRTKLATLSGQPLLVDTSDAALDARLCGLVEIVSGYQDALLYRVADQPAYSAP